VPTPALLRDRASQLFDWIANGDLKVKIGGVYSFSDAALAHAHLESRASTGKLLLVPEQPRPNGSRTHLKAKETTEG
jgi:NADPH2:quinone reductase